MIRKIKGNVSAQVKYLSANNTKIENPKEIADTLAHSFAQKSSSENHSEKFQRNKAKEEKKRLNFNSNNLEFYNKLFSFKELKSALDKAHDSFPGQDKIYYRFLKHLPDTSLSVLFDIFNDIWQKGDLPSSWQKALVIPIPKIKE